MELLLESDKRILSTIQKKARGTSPPALFSHLYRGLVLGFVLENPVNPLLLPIAAGGALEGIPISANANKRIINIIHVAIMVRKITLRISGHTIDRIGHGESFLNWRVRLNSSGERTNVKEILDDISLSKAAPPTNKFLFGHVRLPKPNLMTIVFVQKHLNIIVLHALQTLL